MVGHQPVTGKSQSFESKEPNMDAVKHYFQELSASAGNAWNRFWFTASDVFPLALLRMVAGFAAFYFLVSHTADLILWFGPRGLLPIETVQQLTGGAANNTASFRFSHMLLTNAPSALWLFHVLACLTTLAFALGLFSRVTNVLTLLAVLCYVHRAPMITAQLEAVLTMVLLYLCLAPTGAALSIDSFLARRREKVLPKQSVWANLSVRLLQVHLAGLYLMMGLTKLAGEVWWTGDAVWWLIARTESRAVDLTFFYQFPYLINLWTHGIVAFELTFPILVWNRHLRPLLLGIGVAVWLSILALTGLAAYCLLMIFANMVFVKPQILRQCCAVCCRRCCPAAVADCLISTEQHEAVAA